MENAIMDMIVKVVGTLLITAIGIAGVWLEIQIGKTKKFQNVQNGIQELTNAASITVGALQQQLVENWKKLNEDGKLTKDEVSYLRNTLVSETKKKMSTATLNVLTAAGVDITTLILDTGDALIQQMKNQE